MRQPAKPSTSSQPTAPGDLQVKIGKGGITVIKPGDGEAIAVLQAQAQVLKTRVATLKNEIDGVKAEIAAPGAAPTIGANQIRLQALEGRRIDAEQALQNVEDQLAGIGVRPATVEEIGVPVPFPPGVPFDLNQNGLQDKVTIIAVAAIVFIGAPIAVAIARFIWKRTATRSAPLPSTEDTHRLVRVEQAVDAMSLELERISEGQRYVTKVIAERVGAPAAGQFVATKAEQVERPGNMFGPSSRG